MMRCKIFIMSFLLMLEISAFILQAQERKTTDKKICFEGTVRDAQTQKALSFATIQLTSEEGLVYGIILDNEGLFRFSAIPLGVYVVNVSYIGYEKIEQRMILDKDTSVAFKLKSSFASLNEVVVTASESKGITSASRIDRTAMKHLQPTSFTDLLELLPGGKSADPKMSGVNLMHLREAGSTGEIISSLGIAFVVDGAPINTDGNLQYSPGAISSDASQSYSFGTNAGKESVSKGVDMRTISTDNIESVEIIRGIPSVEYGNLTNGLVKIKRKDAETPVEARFKADQNGKLFSIGKGIRLSDTKNTLNIDLNYLDSKIEPRNDLANYKRFALSARWKSTVRIKDFFLYKNINADYTGSFDNEKYDADVMMKDNRYNTSYNKFGVGGTWEVRFPKRNLFRSLQLTTTISQELNRIKQVKSVGIDRPTAIPNATGTGESDGTYLPYQYDASMTIDGKPVSIYAKFSSLSNFSAGASKHQPKIGVEWSFSKNYGDGQVYDVNRPIQYSSNQRPRRYKDIPGREELAFFAEDDISLPIAGHHLEIVAGLRGQSLLHLSDKYKMNGKFYVDPRLNVQWTFPVFGRGGEWKTYVAGGVGWHTKAPTTAQLYPDYYYEDIAELNYYHANPDFRRIYLMTYKWDTANYDLLPARNRKWELRWGISYEGNSLAVTYFDEQMNNGFRNISYFRTLPYKIYNTASLNGATLTAPPALEDMTYAMDTLLNVYHKVGNGSRIYKQGIEFQFVSQRIRLLKTRITINGAWLRTVTSNSMPIYKASSILMNNKQLKYIGLYIWEDGSEKRMFNTNFMFDTYLNTLGLTFSVSSQCTWFTDSKPLWNDGTPTDYVDKTGTLHPFTETDKTDMVLQHLVNNYFSDYFNRTTVPFAMDVNLKANKEIGKYATLALFVNRILTVYPDYYSGTQLRRRQASPYFGMELNIRY
jgi:hypothetical protein